PASFPTATTTVVSDLGTAYAPPAYTSSTPVGTAAEPGGTGSRRLLLTDTDSGTLHYALVTNGATSPSASVLSAAKSELATWMASKFS
ncbi:MAG: endoglycosylceramidase, partial [Streptomyces sp.]|nr:endoglycosylceramidase [Streptomyces sp.]